MPNHKSAIKRLRTNELRRQRNVSVKSRIHTMSNKASDAIEQGDETAPQLVREIVAVIDRAASNGILHANTASRKKSSLMRRAAAAAKNESAE